MKIEVISRGGGIQSIDEGISLRKEERQVFVVTGDNRGWAVNHVTLDASDDFHLFSEKRQNHLPRIRGCIEKSDV